MAKTAITAQGKSSRKDAMPSGTQRSRYQKLAAAKPQLKGALTDGQAQVLAERAQCRRKISKPDKRAALPDVALLEDMPVSIELDDLVRRKRGDPVT